MPDPIVLSDFYKWSYSDLLLNKTRGDLAEYIVACALNKNVIKTDAWSSFDLFYKDKYKIEVKSAAYIQSWKQKSVSTIRFNISPRREWDFETKKMSVEVKRHADIYVFSLLANKNKHLINPLDLKQWIFYVLTTLELNTIYPKQKSVTLRSLNKNNYEPICFENIKSKIHLKLGL